MPFPQNILNWFEFGNRAPYRQSWTLIAWTIEAKCSEQRPGLLAQRLPLDAQPP